VVEVASPVDLNAWIRVEQVESLPRVRVIVLTEERRQVAETMLWVLDEDAVAEVRVR
jgi:hypothetical protein